MWELVIAYVFGAFTMLVVTCGLHSLWKPEVTRTRSGRDLTVLRKMVPGRRRYYSVDYFSSNQEK